MDLATRTDVLALELITSSPSLFNYAERQLLKAGEPDVIERLVERKIRRLRWNTVGAVAAVLVILPQYVILAMETGRWTPLLTPVLWGLLLIAYTRGLQRDRQGVRDAGTRLVEHLAQARDSARRAG